MNNTMIQLKNIWLNIASLSSCAWRMFSSLVIDSVVCCSYFFSFSFKYSYNYFALQGK